ncbi:hypothetical protein CDCA_CDCA01G0219 [Cyanidium caldarium]|uniref:Uncharacterized protein n=1 Tax=Cyanidium caldarium TaxID=2771 RepID=A0AAV9IPE2_CYACA|nr:hypothetical protein CDCA_CDCA01G0219 [Cyanidium caldarium]
MRAIDVRADRSMRPARWQACQERVRARRGCVSGILPAARASGRSAMTGITGKRVGMDRGAWVFIAMAVVALLAGMSSVGARSGGEARHSVELLRAERAQLHLLVRELRAAVQSGGKGALPSFTRDQLDALLFGSAQQRGVALKQSAVRASATNGDLVLECSAAGKLLYRFSCPSGGSTPSTFTGVATCT